MKTSEPLEDNWHDVLSKAARGLQLDVATLTQKSHGDEKKVRELLEGTCHPATLATVAPILHLNAAALLAIAADHYHPGPIITPDNFKHFATSYHGMQVNSYLLWSEENKTAVAFDTGADLAPLLKILEQHQLQLELILLTHGHSDHVCQLEKLIAATGAQAWIHEADLILQAHPFTFPCPWTLDSTITIEARPTPGHSPGGTTYIIHGTSPTIAVVGDALFAGSVGGIPPSSYEAALKVLQKNVLSLPDETIVAPGHGPLTTVGDEKDHNPFFAK